MARRKVKAAAEYWPIADLVLLENNPRTIKKADMDKLVKSIKDNPDYFEARPIILSNRTGKNVIIAGNQRLKAAEQLGLKEVPAVLLEGLTEDREREIIIRDNVSNGEWDVDGLANSFDIDELKEWGLDLDFTEPEKEIIEDEVPEPPKEPKAKLGDLYKLGSHYLKCGDSTNADDMSSLMGGVLADMVFTDPPYGVAIGDKNKALNSVQPSGRCTTNIEGDTMGEEELYGVLKSAMENVRTNCKDDASYYVTSPQGGSLGLMMMMMMMRDAGLEVRHVLMWEKNTATFSLGRLDYDYQHEPIFYTWTKAHHNYRGGVFRTTVWKVDKPRKCDLHPTMKPIELIANAILDGTKERDIVLDAFGGSGSTLIACEQTDRRCYMMELDPHYVDVIIERWENLTGKKAEKVEV